MQVRMATPADADAIADIYAPYVRDTVISFEARPPSTQEMRSRLTTTLANLPRLVIIDTDRVARYAYAGPTQVTRGLPVVSRCVVVPGDIGSPQKVRLPPSTLY